MPNKMLQLGVRNFVLCTEIINTLIIQSFIYPNDAQIDCSKNAKLYIKIYMRGVSTCFGFHNLHQGATICDLLKL